MQHDAQSTIDSALGNAFHRSDRHFIEQSTAYRVIIGSLLPAVTIAEPAHSIRAGLLSSTSEPPLFCIVAPPAKSLSHDGRCLNPDAKVGVH